METFLNYHVNVSLIAITRRRIYANRINFSDKMPVRAKKAFYKSRKSQPRGYSKWDGGTYRKFRYGCGSAVISSLFTFCVTPNYPY